MEIDRNKAINKNIEKLLSPEFESRFHGRDEKDNGKIESFADMKYNQAGELEFNGENLETVRFYLDTTYMFKKNILNYLCQKLGISDHPKNQGFFWFPERNKWNINEVYFMDKKDVNPDIIYIMESIRQQINNLPKKERAKYRQERK